MIRSVRVIAVAFAVAAVSTPLVAPALANGVESDARRSLASLEASQPVARMLRERAKGVLVFPTMVKAGFMFGGQIGRGVLFKKGRRAGLYNSVAASYGFQAGIQSFGYALFFMTEDALGRLDSTMGFEVGVGPSIVIVDQGVARSLTTTTLTSDVYAFIFNQAGLMAGVGIQGSKITRIGP